MNKKINATNDELQKNVGNYAAVKLSNGRVISGRIQQKEETFWLKLGVKWFKFEDLNIATITIMD